MIPPGPVPHTALKSIPRSRANLRTGGLARTRALWDGVTSAGATGAGGGGTSRTAGSTASEAAGSAAFAAAAAPPADAVTRRRRRLLPPAFGPYPTSMSEPSSASGGSPAPVSSSTELASWESAAVAAPSAAASAPGEEAPSLITSELAGPIVMMGTPTSTVSPSAKSSSTTTPSYGEGSSTSDFAVSISTIAWLTCTSSPGWTSHWTISASVRPSPTSGRRKCCRESVTKYSWLEGKGAVDSVQHPVKVGQVVIFHRGGRIRSVETTHPQHGRIQRVETPLRDRAGKFRTRSKEGRSLMDYDEPAGFFHRSRHRVDIQWRDRTQVNYLGAVALLGQHSGGFLRNRHRRPIRGQRHVTAGLQHSCALKRAGCGIQIRDGVPHLHLGPFPVAALGFKEKDRKSTRLNSSHVAISYAVFCLKKKK